MLNLTDQFIKRVFDLILSLFGIVLTWWIMLIAWIVASLDTKSNGLFIQKRIGKDAKQFEIFKIKTMKSMEGEKSTVTTSSDIRITKSGKFFRRWKIDELPQLFNVLFGDMSFVGPRPDVSGFADILEGEDREILNLRPGITGPATLKYKEEEVLLSQQKDPEAYNREVIWPDKVKINLDYMQTWSLKKDIIYIIRSITG